MSEAFDLEAMERALAASSPDRPGGRLGQDERDALRRRKDNTLPPLVARAVEAVDSERDLEGARLALQAIAAHPENVAGYIAGAVALDRLGFLQHALAFYEQALARAPDDPRICALLGSTALRCRQPELAERFYRLALRLEPNSISHVNNLAGVLRDLGRFNDAIELLRNRLYTAPESASLWNTLGTVVQEQGDPETAQTFLSEAARLDPKLASAYHNLGVALTDLGRFGEAAASLEQAMTLVGSVAERAEMQSAHAYALLGAGRVEEGWIEYEARFDPRARETTFIRAPRPRWDLRTPLDGKSILVMGEQGLGDEILFMNATADLIAQAGQVTIACQARLHPLFARSFPSARIVRHLTSSANGRITRLAANEDWEGVDLWTPMGDLARAFRNSLDSFPSDAFLRADPARVTEFKQQLAGAQGVKIGIVWKSMVMSAKRARFFAPFSAWAPLFQMPDASFYSLQYGDTQSEERMATEKWGVTLRAFDGLDVKDDLDGVAAASCALDLIVGPPNANTNLAAACGAQTWLIARHQEWPMLGTDRMPWYPGARMFCADGRWREMFETMAKELRAGASRADAA